MPKRALTSLFCLSLTWTAACSKSAPEPAQHPPAPPNPPTEAAGAEPTAAKPAGQRDERSAVGAARGRAPNGPAKNPYLAAETYAVTHFDPSQSDAMPYPAPRGAFKVDLRQAPGIDHGPINILTAASTSPSFMWAVSSQGVAYVDVSGNGFREVARLPAPGVKVFPPGKLHTVLGQSFSDVAQVKLAVTKELGLDWTRIANGVYSVVDRDNRVYYSTADGKVVVFALEDAKNPSAGIEVVKTRDFKDLLGPKHMLAGLNMTYDGKLVVQGDNLIAVVERTLDGEPSVIRYGKGERTTNAAAIDEKNGIYVASDKVMRKLVWTGTKLSESEADGAWSAPYDTGRQPPTVKIGAGTGSTPTLMGFEDDPDKLVVITDGADRMKLVAFWRDAIPKDAKAVPGAKSSRVAGQIQVTCGLSPAPEFVQTEQSVVVSGYGAFVVNNIAERGEPDKLVDVVALGPINPPGKGAERFEWEPNGDAFRSVWTRSDAVSTSMVPSVSVPAGIVFVNGYTAKDGWEVTGMDWQSGGTVHRTIFGQDNLGNGAYAIIQLFPNGDLLFNGIAGPSRVRMEQSLVGSASNVVPSR
jgi:hypothetical protein